MNFIRKTAVILTLSALMASFQNCGGELKSISLKSAPEDKPKSITNLKLYTFNHSLWDHAVSLYQRVPYWLNQFAVHEGVELGTNGQFGQLSYHAVPASNQNVYFGVEGSTYNPWTTGDFADQDFPYVLFMHSNFQQVGESFDNATLLSDSFRVLDYVEANEPTAEKILYVHWPETGGVPGVAGSANLSAADWETYWTYTRTDYLSWHVNHVGAVEAQRPNYDPIRVIPVGPVMADLLLNEAYFDGISSLVFFEDDAPHGTSSLYCLAALIVYRAMYGSVINSNGYTFPAAANVDPSITNNLQAIINYIDTRLAFYSNSGVRVY